MMEFVLPGTPAGVGPLQRGDVMDASVTGHGEISLVVTLPRPLPILCIVKKHPITIRRPL
ncbi:hypothetical protein [Cupriavidus necator]|uniref:hypothetical protein n=1 Tax=Cupriavidus necator TaxID=106590 RepID=UPI0005A07D51|nr:hypothetical protein [Cupriavidus necator]